MCILCFRHWDLVPFACASFWLMLHFYLTLCRVLCKDYEMEETFLTGSDLCVDHELITPCILTTVQLQYLWALLLSVS